MGGLGPGIGGLEYLVIAAVALIVVGPERLPGMLRALGKMVARARGMANEFRASFDDMARQTELDELRKEVEALRQGQGMVALGADADAAFKDIKADLERPLDETPSRAVVLDQPEFPDPAPQMTPLTPEPAATPKVRKPRKARSTAPAPVAAAKPRAPRKAPRTPAP